MSGSWIDVVVQPNKNCDYRYDEGPEEYRTFSRHMGPGDAASFGIVLHTDNL